MRPLVVLLLVLGSLAALLFALLTLGDSGRQVDEGRGMVVVPPPQGGEQAPDLLTPSAPEVQETRQVPGEETRQALVPDAVGRKVSFGAIEGKVIDLEGLPIAKARVNLLNTRPSALAEDIQALRGEDPPRPVAKLDTDATGAFRFDQLDPRKDWSLVVTHDNYLRSMSELAIAVPDGGTWHEVVILEPGKAVSGMVRDARSGQPVAGALLTVDGPFARMSRRKSPGRLEATTDQNGAYLFPNVGATPAQARILTVSAPGYATQVHNNFSLVTVGPTPTKFKNVQPTSGAIEGREQDFMLEPGLVIAGRIVSPDRRGVAGIEVEALSQSGTINSEGMAKSGKNGEFLIEGLAEGIYTVKINATKFDASPLQRVEAGSTDVVIELFEQAMVTGKVIDSGGRPLSTFVVKARVSNEMGKAFGGVAAQRSVKDSRDGSFELDGLPEGSYVVEAIADGFASCFSDTFAATQGLVTSDIVVRMTRGGSLGGRILEAYSNAPVVGAEISTMDNDWIEGEIWELFGAMEPTATTKTKVFTNAEGRFDIPVMTPGTYQVLVKAKGYSPLNLKDVLVVEGQATEIPGQVLIKGAVITGVIYGRDGSVQPGASVQLTPADQGLEGHRSARADGTGRYVIENARPGTYELCATRRNSGSGNPFEALGDMNQSKIEISIEDGGVHEFDLRLGNTGRN